MTGNAPAVPAVQRRFHFLPDGTSPDAAILIAARGIRAFGDGFVSILLPVHLAALGFSSTGIGLLTTATLLGSAVLTLLVGQLAHRWRRIDLLLRTAMLMIATGVGFFVLDGFWPLIVLAFVGTINPSTGDVSVFLPTEQSLLPQTTDEKHRTAIFARYSLTGSLVGAFGSLGAGAPTLIARWFGISSEHSVTIMFGIYALLGVIIALLYRRLSPQIEPEQKLDSSALGPSQHTVYRLAGLFSLDSFAGGFSLQSVIALWLFMRFDLSVATAGTIFFWAGLLSAFSQLLAPIVARWIGLINTMVFSHLPANVFLILTPLMPTLPLAILCLLLRSALAQMDIPARTSYVMAVVTPAERPAAASLTNVPRSLATAISPTIAGSLLQTTVFGWPLIIGGSLKITYDLLLLRMFHDVRPPEEQSVVLEKIVPAKAEATGRD